MNSSNIDLKHYHDCCLIIADEVKRLCDKNKIKYSLDGGSFLGAVRHKGFIPWDDDMDFAMPYEEYLRFLDICKTDIGDDFLLVNMDTDKSYPFFYSKIVLKGTYIRESFCNETRDNGIFVDIFPYQKLPKSYLIRHILSLKAGFLKKILWMKQGFGKSIKDEGFLQKIKYNLGCLISKFFSYDFVKVKYISLLKKYESLSYDDCYLATIDFNETFFINLTYDKTFAKLKKYQFSGKEYSCYENYDFYLKARYGEDYMTPPPPQKQIGHSITFVDFGKF